MAQFYINASTGNDSTGSGTAVSPWQTITKGLSGSALGDTINLQNAAATYPWTGSSINVTSRSFVGASVSGCVIDSSSSTFYIYMNTVNGVFNFTNLTFQKATTPSGQPMFLSLQSGATITFTNCILHDVVGSDVGMFWDLVGNGTWNIIASSFYNISGTAINSGSTFLTLSSGTTFNITNTTYYNTAITANSFKFTGTNGTLVLKNNIISTVNAVAFINISSPTMTGSTNNCIFGYTSVPTLTGTIASDPLFVNASSNNFNLRPTSPCIDAGVII